MATVEELGNQWRQMLERHDALADSDGVVQSDIVDFVTSQLRRLTRRAASAELHSCAEAAALMRMGIVDHGIDMDDGSAGSAALKAVLKYLESFEMERQSTVLQDPQHFT